MPLSAKNIAQWKVFQMLGGVSGEDIAFTPDGKLIAVAQQNQVVFYDAQSLKARITINTDAPVIALLISPDGNELLVMNENHQVMRYKLPSGEFLSTLESFRDIKDFCLEGQTVSAYVWGWADLYCLPDQSASFPSYRSFLGLITIAFNNDATLAILGGQEGFKLVSLKGNQIDKVIWQKSIRKYFWGGAASFSPNGQVVALGTWNPGVVYIAKIDTGEVIAEYAIGGMVKGLYFSPDGSQLAVVSTTTSKVIQLEDGKVSELGGISPGLSNGMDFSSDGQQLLISNDANQVQLWNVNDGSLLHQWDNVSEGGFYSLNDQYIIIVDDGIIRFIDRETYEIIRELQGGSSFSLSFSPDGSQIALGLWIKKGQQSPTDGIQVLDSSDGSLIQAFAGNECFDESYSICTLKSIFTHDGKILITTGGRGIKFFDLASGKQTQRWFDPKMTNVFEIELVLDGTLLIARGNEGIKFWTVNTEGITPNPIGNIPCRYCWFVFDAKGQHMFTSKYIENHTPTPDKYIIKIYRSSDQTLLGSFDVILGDNVPLSRDPISISPEGDILAISTNGKVYFYGVQP